MSTLQRIIDSTHSLPTLPIAVSRLYSLIQDSEASVADLDKVIKPDPALTANLLRLANSPYYGLARKVNSSREAIGMLGMKRVVEAVTSVSFSRLIPSQLPGYNLDAQAFWIHSVAVAIICERLALELNLKIPELTFTAGLLHDMGKLAIGSFIAEQTDEFRHLLSNAKQSFIIAEQQVLGTDHAEIGAGIAENWNLPETIGKVSRWHHSPTELSSDDYDSTLVDLVHVADGLAHILGYGTDFGELSRTIDDTVPKRLGVKVQRLERVASETLDKIREMGQLYVKPGGE
jgi:putative nucleotidyltransferase with HDIG domain